MMNGLHDLLEKIRKIEEADDATAKGGQVYPDGNRGNGFQPNTQQAAPATVNNAPANNAPATAQAAPSKEEEFEKMMQAREARQAMAQSAAMLQKLIKTPMQQLGNGQNAINPTTGVFYYGQNGNAQPMPLNFISQDPTLANALKATGLTVISSKAKMPSSFTAGDGTPGGMAQLDPASLQKIKDPNFGKAAPAAQQQAPAAQQQAPAAQQQAPAVQANPEMTKKLDRLKEILGMKVTNATADTTGAPQYNAGKDSQAANVAPPAAPANQPTMSYAGNQVTESITFKSRIANILAESGIMTGIMEKQVVGEANPQRAELDALWSEISKAMETPGALTPEQRKDVENLTQAVQQFQQNNPLNAPATAPVKVNPHDGQGGTDPSATTTATPAPAKDVQALATANKIADPNKIKVGQQITLPDGTAYTVAPGDNLTNILAGKRKGKAPAAAAPTAPAPTLPANKTKKVQPTAPANNGTAQYPAPTAPAPTAPAASAVPTDVLAKAVPKPKVDDQYWVNGVRYSFQNIPHAGQGWKQDDPGMFGADRTTRSRSSAKYTGPDKTRKAESVEESGFMNDELNRLISLVHHR